MTEPLPKPDKPGRWKVTWSNGDTEEVEVMEVERADTHEVNLWFWNLARSAHMYPVGDGHLGKWEAL